MVTYRGMPKASKEELAHLERVRALPCCMCLPGEQNSITEAHHILSGGRRLGHFFVIPLCKGKHHENVHLLRGEATQQLWRQVNATLGITRDWPASKIIPRPLSGQLAQPALLTDRDQPLRRPTLRLRK